MAPNVFGFRGDSCKARALNLAFLSAVWLLFGDSAPLEDFANTGYMELDESWMKSLPKVTAAEATPDLAPAVPEGQAALKSDVESIPDADAGDQHKASDILVDFSERRMRSFGKEVDIPLEDIAGMRNLIGLRQKVFHGKNCKTSEDIELLGVEFGSQLALLDQLLAAMKNGLKDFLAVRSALVSSSCVCKEALLLFTSGLNSNSKVWGLTVEFHPDWRGLHVCRQGFAPGVGSMVFCAACLGTLRFGTMGIGRFSRIVSRVAAGVDQAVQQEEVRDRGEGQSKENQSRRCEAEAGGGGRQGGLGTHQPRKADPELLSLLGLCWPPCHRCVRRHRRLVVDHGREEG